MARLRFLRALTVVLLVLLALQFELGIAVNLSPNLKEVPPVAGSVSAVWHALAEVGDEALVHGLVAALLAVVSLASLVLAVRSGSRIATVIGILSFATIALAAVTGVLFTMSGFKNDGDSHGMATSFLLSFSLNFVQVCVLFVKLRS